MSISRQVTLSEILAALSHALDLTEGQPEGHCVRCCYIGTQIGKRLKLDMAQLSDLYYTLLLKDLGCSSNAARICSLYLTDDRTFKNDFKQIDGSLSQALRFVLNQTGMKTGMAKRFRALYQVLKDGGEISRELIETRCNRGAQIALQMRFSQQVADGILNLDEHWDGSGQPNKVQREDIPLFSQVALLAQVADVFHTSSGPAAAKSEVLARSGTWFNPKLAELFGEIADNSEFWEKLESPDLQTFVLREEPGRKKREIDDNYLDDIAEAFSQVVDSKSPYTAGHSERVTIFSDLIAEQLGYDLEGRRRLKRGALLHDIGKLGISNSILDKPGKLGDEEFQIVKMHPVHSRNILKPISVFKDILAIAGGHHEKLNGQGYPDGLKGDEINMDTRIVAVADIFDALTAERPYRKPIPEDKALAMMDEMAKEEIDPKCLIALKIALEDFKNVAA